MALPGSGSLSIKNAAGAGRSISQEVDGNETGNKSLLTLSTTAGKTAPHGMVEFYNYSNVATTNVNLTSTAVTGSTATGSYRGSTASVYLNFSNSGTFGAGTFAVTIQRYLELYGNATGAEANAVSTRSVMNTTMTTSAVTTFQLSKTYAGAPTFGFTTSAVSDSFYVQSNSLISYHIRAEERGTNASVNAYSEIFITSVWQINTVVPTRVSSFLYGIGTSLV